MNPQINSEPYTKVFNLFEYVQKTIKHRLANSTESANESGFKDFEEGDSFEFECESEYIMNFIHERQLNLADTIALSLTIMPHLSPDLLYKICESAEGDPLKLAMIGGVKAKNQLSIIPTGETLLFCLAGNSVEQRIYYYDYFMNHSPLFQNGIIEFEQLASGEPKLSAKMILSDDYVDYFLFGRFSKPKMSSDFPASKIETQLDWENLVLKETTVNQIKEISSWLINNDKVMNDWGMAKKLKPGYRVMFYGPPGTGKTLTASLLGKHIGKEVYRIDLSLIVSKYIGETEKNLARLFDRASNKDWILFFDEADSIFGKRTSVKDAHDKYANQEVSYLLQRIESHPGLVIIATNLKNNIDAAFTRRFHSMIEFEQPGEKERLKIWNDYIPKILELDPRIALDEIAKNYNLSGANILNVVQYACLKAADSNKDIIDYNALIDGIRKEYTKEGRVFK